MRILVTGGAGFVGSNLCQRLLKDNNHVICVDNFFTGSKDNIKDLLENENFEFVEKDITEPLDIKADIIYNLASPAAPASFKADPIFTLKVNTVGVVNLLELVRKYDSQLIHFSTIRVNETDTFSDSACYTEGKRCAETLINEYSKKYNLNTRIVRLDNIYGPRMSIHDSRVMPQFIIRALKNEDLVVYKNGKMKSSFLYIDDMLDALLKGRTLIKHSKDITILELAKIVVFALFSESKIFIEDNGEITDYEPHIHVEKLIEGIMKTAYYFKRKIN